MTAQNDFESVDDFKFIVLDGDFFKQIFQQFSVSSGINLFLREIKFQLFQRKKVWAFEAVDEQFGKFLGFPFDRDKSLLVEVLFEEFKSMFFVILIFLIPFSLNKEFS